MAVYLAVHYVSDQFVRMPKACRLHPFLRLTDCERRTTVIWLVTQTQCPRLSPISLIRAWLAKMKCHPGLTIPRMPAEVRREREVEGARWHGRPLTSAPPAVMKSRRWTLTEGEQPPGVRVGGTAHPLPPAADRLHSERRGVVVGSDVHPPSVGRRVIDP